MQSKKIKLLRLIDELLSQFDQNKYIIIQLIHLRHNIKNILSEDSIDLEIERFINKYRERIIFKDFSIFEKTPIAIEAKIIWESLDQNNKEILWKWINFVCEN